MLVQSSLHHMCHSYCSPVRAPLQAMTWHVKEWSSVFLPDPVDAVGGVETLRRFILFLNWQSQEHTGKVSECVFLLLQALESLLDDDNKLSHSSTPLCCTCSILGGSSLNSIVFYHIALWRVMVHSKFQIPLFLICHLIQKKSVYTVLNLYIICSVIETMQLSTKQ